MLGEAMATIVWSMNVMATAKSLAMSARFFDALPEPLAASDGVASCAAAGSSAMPGVVMSAPASTYRAGEIEAQITHGTSQVEQSLPEAAEIGSHS
jgi:hypothetical protein